MAYSNPTARWASAPLLVPKAGSSPFRFIVDLRLVNKYTVQHSHPMPNIECELGKLAKSKYFASFDLSHGYWQLPLDEGSQECQSFVTPDGVYSPTRVLHGTTNAVRYLQSALENMLLKPLGNQFLIWLDDILYHSPDIPIHQRNLEMVFDLCSRNRVRLNPRKCELISERVRWCGRIVSHEGIRFDP